MASKSVTNGDINETADGLRTLVNVTEHAMDSDASKIDEGLYSRQLYVMGHEAQLKMGSANILIVGLDGIGVEIAKNIILAGVKSVTLHDNVLTSYMDLAANFYMTEKDIGRPRAQVCLNRLSDLNPYVHVREASGELTEKMLQQYRAVVSVNCSSAEDYRLNDLCHLNSIAFISTKGRGVFGSVFCDFGDAFTVTDTNGKQPVDRMLASISASDPPLVTVHEDERHQLETGDFVTFREIRGLEFLNGSRPREITVTGPYTFTLNWTDEKERQLFSKSGYIGGGYVSQVKQPATLKFKRLAEAMQSPGEFLLTDFSKMDRPNLLHIAFQALHVYHEELGELPEAGNLEHATKVYEYAVAINDKAASANQFAVDDLQDENSKKVITALSLGSRGVLSPMAAFLGGIVGQEALKACSGKFTPVHQFLYFDAMECLPDSVFSGDMKNFAPVQSRYDSQIAVFGQEIQQKLQELNMFLVGAGAIGCEMLKNWCMMGISTNDGAVTHITDMDTIEKSNLNRQFLFRSSDVQKPKAKVAAAAVKSMNPAMNVQSYVCRVGLETEECFNDDFFESLSGVCTALDNVEARLYIDQRCLFYGKPMLESGTLGTQGNTQIVVPHITENYGASRDPPEKSIPICTLKNFPNAIEHTLQWARDWFEGEFNQTPVTVNQYLTASDFQKQLQIQQNTKLETLLRLKDSLITNQPKNFEDCIVWARHKFQEMFCNQIKQLLYNFPLDQTTSAGMPFWSGPKRPPTAISFDCNEPLHLDFISSVAVSRAKMYGIAGDCDRQQMMQVLSKLTVPEFRPKIGVKIATTEAEIKEESAPIADGSDAQCDLILNELPSPATHKDYQMIPIEFDKDNDEHMRVIVATSNLRARCYKIPEADMYKSRLIAGKIIPAIATTTALVTGLVCFELYKVIQSKPIQVYKNGFVNLALPLFAFSEPLAPKQTTTKLRGEDYKWTPWDRIDIDGKDMTLKDFLSYCETTYDIEISMLSYGVTILYAMYSAKSRSPERMALTLSALVETVTKKSMNSAQKYLILEVCASDLDGEDVEIPYIRCRLK